MKKLSKEKGELQSLLEVAAGCQIPLDVSKGRAGIGGLPAQRARIRPTGELSLASKVLLSKPDGSVSEKESMLMPVLGLGTGFADCLKSPKDGTLYDVDVTEEAYDSDDGLEHIKMLKDSECELPPLSLYESALQSGTRLVDTAYIYGT